MILQEIAAGHRRLVAAQTEIMRSHDRNSEIGLVFDGWACRYRLLPDGQRQILDVHLAGDLVGLDCALLKGSPDFLVALTDVTYGTIGYDRFLALLGNPDVALYVLSFLAKERRRLDGHLAAIGQMIAEEKIAVLLIEFHDRLRLRRMGDGKSFHFPLTQQQLGDFLGMTVVHVNRVLKRLRDGGIIDVRHRLVVIHDMERLAALATGQTEAPPFHRAAG